MQQRISQISLMGTASLILAFLWDELFAPQTTDQNGSWWFHPDDRVFQGYRLTHQPSPWMGDFSHMLFTPINGKLQENTLSMLKVLTAQKKVYLPDSSVDLSITLWHLFYIDT